MPWLTPDESWALTLTTFAGLSTSLGAAVAVIRQPDDALLAFLLGNAIGVMFLLSVAEMWLHQALEHGWPEITIAFAAGALLYQLAQPFIPDFGSHHHDTDFEKLQHMWEDNKGHATCVPIASPSRPERQDSGGNMAERRSSRASVSSTTTAELIADATVGRRDPPRPSSSNGSSGGGSGPGSISKGMRPRQLLRLGLLMAVTMTLHNLPEGFAVAFAAFTDFGPVMAAAIAFHNIPEGVIVAAPVYAATGSRWKALGLATASGLSEPLGALLALLVVKPFLTESRLHYILGFVGGLMAAVSVLELWPEAKKCRNDGRMYWGIAVGMALMGVTLIYV